MNKIDLFNELQQLGDNNALKNQRLKRIANSLCWRQKFQNSAAYQLFLEDGRSLNLSQILNGESAGVGTGANVWPAAHILAKYFEKKYVRNGFSVNSILDDIRVCDLGSGTGCVGLAAAAFGATVTLTDMNCILPLTEQNMKDCCSALNISTKKVLIQPYLWGESAIHLHPPFDIIFVSDCILPKLYPIEPLVKVGCFLNFSLFNFYIYNCKSRYYQIYA